MDFQTRFQSQEQIGARQRFWDLFQVAYSMWKTIHPTLPGTVYITIDQAVVPELHTKTTGESLGQQANNLPSRWPKQTYDLWEFVVELYRQVKNTHNLDGMTLLLLKKEELPEFHKVRQSLAKFWNDWGEQIYGNKDPREKWVGEHLQQEGRLLKVLAYLEMALAQHDTSRGTGKVWLFKAMKRANKIWLPPKTST